MLAKLKGLKTYIVAGLLAGVAAINGAGIDDTASVVSEHAPEAGAVLAAGIVLGRAIVSLFRKLRADGVIQ